VNSAGPGAEDVVISGGHGARDTSGRPYAASIVVPAYNEQDRIGPLLPVLAAAASELGYLVLVVCNGCKDATASMARAVPGLTVVEVARASKPHALNLADEIAGDVFPRLYVDADVRTTTDSLELLVDALRVDEPLAVRPRATYLTENAPWTSRAFYESRSIVPSTRRWHELHLEGHHIYGTNAKGRARFDDFPEEGQIMEDAFFDRMFDPAEKLAVLDAVVSVPLPSTTRALVRGMTRVYQGNWELTAWLEKNRPDRAGIERPEPAPERTIFQTASYLARGGSTFDSWAPRPVAIVLTATALRKVAELRARRLVRAGRQADWR